MGPVVWSEDPSQRQHRAHGSCQQDLDLGAVSSNVIPQAGNTPNYVAPFVVRQQAGDGNCLFRSISDQVYGSPEHHALVRDRCTKYIASERNYFEQFVTEPFEKFLDRIGREGEWGDDVEIEALSEIYDCRIEIYSTYSHKLMRTFHEACEAKWPHPIRLQYEGHAHYNSLAPKTGLVPIAASTPGRQVAVGDIEDAAIATSQRRREAGQRRTGAGEADIELTDQEFLDESIKLSRQEFEHKSFEEMDRALEASRSEWEHSERRLMDEEVVDAVMQQSVLEEEQLQLSFAMKESRTMLFQQSAATYGSSLSSAGERDGSHRQELSYPESVYAVMSMGFPLEKCVQAYHLVGDNPDGILAFCCQTIGR